MTAMDGRRIREIGWHRPENRLAPEKTLVGTGRMTGMDGRRIHLPTVVAMAVVVYAATIALHELGHVATGLLAGGDPGFVSTTDTRGDWSALGRTGYVAVGAGGSLVNVLLAALGLALLARRPRPSGRLFAWLLFAVNGSLTGFYLLVSPLAGFGDWDTVASRFAPSWPLRLGLAAAGAALTVWVTQAAGKRLAPFVAMLPSGERETGSLALARTCWLTGGALAVAAALWSPLGLGWALLVALGSTLGCTWPLMPAARLAARQATEPANQGGRILVPMNHTWIVAGTLVAALFIFVLGPGLEL